MAKYNSTQKKLLEKAGLDPNITIWELLGIYTNDEGLLEPDAAEVKANYNSVQSALARLETDHKLTDEELKSLTILRRSFGKFMSQKVVAQYERQGQAVPGFQLRSGPVISSTESDEDFFSDVDLSSIPNAPPTGSKLSKQSNTELAREALARLANTVGSPTPLPTPPTPEERSAGTELTEAKVEPDKSFINRPIDVSVETPEVQLPFSASTSTPQIGDIYPQIVGMGGSDVNFNYTTNAGERETLNDPLSSLYHSPFESLNPLSLFNFPATMLRAASGRQIEQYETIAQDQRTYSATTATLPTDSSSPFSGPIPSISTQGDMGLIPPAYPPESTTSPVVIAQGPPSNQPQLIAATPSNQLGPYFPPQQVVPSGGSGVPPQATPITVQATPYVYQNVTQPGLPTPTQVNLFNTTQNPSPQPPTVLNSSNPTMLPPAPPPAPGWTGTVPLQPSMTTPDLDGFRSGLAGLFDRIFSALGSSAEQLAQAKLHQAQKSKHKAQADIYQYPADLQAAKDDLYAAESDLTAANASGVGVEEAQAKVERAKAKVEGTQRRGEAAPARLEAAKVAYSKAQDDLEAAQNPMNKAMAAFSVFKEGIGANSAGFKAGVGGISAAFSSAAKGEGGQAIGDLLGGLAGALGGVAGAATGVIGAYFTTGQKLKDFGAAIDSANLKFAEFSAAMATVQAKATIRDIQLSQRRGDRMAPYAEKQVQTQKDFEAEWSEYEDAAMAFFGDLKMFGQEAFLSIKQGTDSMIGYLIGIEMNTRKDRPEPAPTFKDIMEEQIQLELERRRGRLPPRPPI